MTFRLLTSDLVEKERKKAEKDAKFAAKKAKAEAEKKQSSAIVGDAKKKEKKGKTETPVVEVPYVEETPAGQKKSQSNEILLSCKNTDCSSSCQS